MTPITANQAASHAGLLETWIEQPVTRASTASAREAFDELAAILLEQPGLRDQFSGYLLNVFLMTGLLRDYRALNGYARKVNNPDLLHEVDAVVRIELPDIWIVNALRRGETEAAIVCFFEKNDHDRIRHSAEALIKACPNRTDILVSGRRRMVDYQIGRGTRSRYRRACRILKTLRIELERANQPQLWMRAIDDLLLEYGHRPALVDELEKASLI